MLLGLVPPVPGLRRPHIYLSHEQISSQEYFFIDPQVTTKNRRLRIMMRGTRTVSTLTEEQIHRKRSVDRKAQRAFRQRTKECISNLERQVVELRQSSTRRESQLQRELQTLREHNKKLIHCLDSIAGLASTSADDDDAEPQDRPSRQTRSPGRSTSPTVGNTIRGPQAMHSLQSSQSSNDQCNILTQVNNGAENMRYSRVMDTIAIDSVEPGSDTSEALQFPTRHNESSTLLARSGTSGLFEEDDDRSIALHISTSAKGGASESPESTFHGHTPDSPYSSLPNLQIVPSSNIIPRVDASTSSITDTSATVNTPCYADAKQVFTVLPVHVPATCPLDRILLGFLNSRRAMLSDGIPTDTVVGPVKASVTALIHTELSVRVHPLSRVMSEVLSTYPLVGKAEQMALFYLMHQTMRVRFRPLFPQVTS
jgi:hypothetical protein